MGLRETAKADLGHIMADTETGFAWPITITDPNGTVGNLTGMSDDIAQVIDPNTGEAVSGRYASVAITIADLTAQGLGLPVGVADTTGKPWVVQFDDINGNAHKFKVDQSNPDRAAGLVTCILGVYQ